jgi:ATP-dependent helicase/nuclease subunit B
MPVPEEIKRAFTSGATILTANMRAARWLKREYAFEQRRAGGRVWATPAIEDWDTWLRNQWQAHAFANADAPLLLTSLQERRVWARIQREAAVEVVSPASIAALAETAYALLSAYEAHAERGHAWGKTDAESFRLWAAHFDRECARRNWMSRAGLEAKVATLLDAKALPREILLVGFDRTTPAQDGVLRAFGTCGVDVRFPGAAFAEPQVQFIRAAGQRDEITACAWWARAQVERNPEVRVGVLVPDLRAMHNEIDRVFRRVLMPETDDIFADHASPFEFSLGQPLAHVPLVRAALLLLRWLHRALLEEEISWLLLSGFLSADGREYLSLAEDDAKRRGFGSLSMEITLPAFLKQAGRSRLPLLTKLEDARRAAASNRIEAENRLPGRWVDLAQSLLHKAGWPGEGEHGSFHFQVLRRWERALDEVALLDFDGQRTSYGDFLKMLEAHAQENIFSLESKGAPVQIMGALEASGQQFDAIWFLSADDESWPQHGRPHPLLPNELQRRLRMPYADTEGDLELARAATARIAASAPVVVFSRPERNKDGELRPSPLLPRDANWEDALETFPPQWIGHETLDLEEIEDASGRVRWPVDQSPGGADVLKHQAACPFRAFAEKRLRAKEFNRSEWGLTPAERGTLLHKTLEKIWSPSEGALHSLDDLQAAIREGRLTAILSSAISRSFARFDAAEDPWLAAYLPSEQNRLLKLLKQWMEIEAGRMPFEVIDCEAKMDAKVGDLQLSLRADRVDRVAGNDRILIDYKSGKVSPKDWQLPRPNDPQMPLYVVFGNIENVRGALFARIRLEDMSLTGSVTDPQSQVFADIRAGSALAENRYSGAMQDEWHDALLELAEEFLRGEAVVKPKNGKKTCQNCPMPGLCRVADLRSPLEENADADGNGDE